MDPSELPGVLDAIAARCAADAATAAVTAMGRTYSRAVKYTLSQRTHEPGEFTRGGRGLPPAKVSGDLRKSVKFAAGASGGVVATSSVAPHTIYASLQETGMPSPIVPVRKRFMHFVNDGGNWFLKTVHVGPHPYMAPTTARCIGNGSLSRSAMKAFEIAVWGR